MASFFLQTIEHLFQNEEVYLYGSLLRISEEESAKVAHFLSLQYEQEAIEHPLEVPEFDMQAGLWAAEYLYKAAQFLLYRQLNNEETYQLLKGFSGLVSPSTMLSVDLTFRFLPFVIEQARKINPEDQLIEILERQLSTWHYSAIGYQFVNKKLLSENEFPITTILSNPSLLQLFADRVIEKKDLRFSENPILKRYLEANMGLYANDFWKEFTLKHQQEK